jgi:hypothetical protein
MTAALTQAALAEVLQGAVRAFNHKIDSACPKCNHHNRDEFGLKVFGIGKHCRCFNLSDAAGLTDPPYCKCGHETYD